MKRFFVQSFGCRASQADGAGIDAALGAGGMTRVATEAEAELVVLNTCTVTAAADSDARQAIRRLQRENPNAKILVTGCYAQRAPEELARMDGVAWVVGNSHKAELADIVLGTGSEEYHGSVFASDIASARDFKATPVVTSYADRTRPTLKVQDGCGNKCSFCIIPSVRGRSRSAAPDSVIEQVRELAAHYAEVVLSGINLGRWGRDLPGNLRFIDLLRHILDETPTQRIRLSSIEPMDWSAELLSLMASEPRIAKHVHIPLQSGSDSVLKRMYRKYRIHHYASRIELANRLMPNAAIGADVMTGFPGESDFEFQETVRFIEEQPFTYLHVFTYSERPGTAAADYADSVPVAVRRERTAVLRALSDRKNLAFRQRMIGRRLSCVTLHENKALSTNYLPVELSTPREPNRIVDLEIGSLSTSCLREKSLLPVLSN
ncbi:MAG TPA: tRNA (N(6)-L-threonylcarbamoyladenosine(37)-C(2))-methylthiotransferase MtaB [Bryobacteraceae bacterium]|nr:tRNA (N(6)-L-threonylcarbamoyladenosine(37)-C(2))-methylthiotransferase MtaB [Bryobacteraceae bacterium]